MVTEAQKKEQDAWTKKAAAAGVSLKGLDLEDAQHVDRIYNVLGVTELPAQTRLLEFIKDLQKEEQQPKQASSSTSSSTTTTMATAWERINTTDNGQAFKAWLTNRMVTEEVFNEFNFEKIDELRTKFEKQQQPNGKLRCCFQMLLRIRK